MSALLLGAICLPSFIFSISQDAEARPAEDLPGTKVIKVTVNDDDVPGDGKEDFTRGDSAGYDAEPDEKLPGMQASREASISNQQKYNEMINNEIITDPVDAHARVATGHENEIGDIPDVEVIMISIDVPDDEKEGFTHGDSTEYDAKPDFNIKHHIGKTEIPVGWQGDGRRL